MCPGSDGDKQESEKKEPRARFFYRTRGPFQRVVANFSIEEVYNGTPRRAHFALELTGNPRWQTRTKRMNTMIKMTHPLKFTTSNKHYAPTSDLRQLVFQV